MKLRILQSDKGDCLLLEARSGELVLCDGGMGTAMRDVVRNELATLRDQGRAIEYAYVSHIDNDHINGILQLLSDALDWKNYDRGLKSGLAVTEPEGPRPPDIRGVLHNGFPAQLKAVDTPKKVIVEAVAATRALSVARTQDSDTPSIAGGEILAGPTDVAESVLLERYLARDALNIPLNKLPGADRGRALLYYGHPRGSFNVGTMKFTLLGPTTKELKALKAGWVNYLETTGDKLKEKLDALEDRITTFGVDRAPEPGFGSRDWQGIPDIDGVTVPNISSLMFMVEEGTKKLLLTGDGQQKFILEGLERTGFLEKGGNTPLRVTVLKVQHHGSEHNLDQPFANRVHADHYVFCGNGSHGNPDPQVIDFIVESRLEDKRPYEFWFSSAPNSKDKSTAPGRYEHLSKVRKDVTALAKKSEGRVTVHFNTKVGIDLPI